jgi:hypothetical protein
MSQYCEERYEVYAENRTTARKAHECDACDGAIAPGDIYYRVRWVYDGSADGVKRCARCQFIHEHLRKLGDGDMWPAEKLDCGEEYEQHWGVKPPAAIAELAFWRPGDPLPAITPCSDLGRWSIMVCRDGWWLKQGTRCQRGELPWLPASRCEVACSSGELSA